MRALFRRIAPFHAIIITSALVYLCMARPAAAADWPTYQHDASRSGSTADAPPRDPQLAWTYQSAVRPRAAWDEPALWDGWSKTHDLKNRQIFDKVFHVAVVNDRVYFGSSVDDAVHCLDGTSGQSLWTFSTEGPVRLAPTVAEGRVYVGSDDGHVYCLDATSGKLHWKRSLAESSRRVAGNGRVISPWAIRTGIVVSGDTLFCGAGVIPSDGVSVLALDAHSGETKWKTEMRDLPAQGYMLASSSRLYVVTSRDTPIVLDAATGKRLYKVKGGAGGTYALLAGDTLLYGPSKTGNVQQVGGKEDVLASFQGNHMIVAQPNSYLHSQEELSALDRGRYVKLYAERIALAKTRAAREKSLKEAQAAKEPDAEKVTALKAEVAELLARHQALGEELKACLKWRTQCDCRDALILAGSTLVAGGEGRVMAVDANTGDRLWQRDLLGRAYGLASSNGRLFVSTDEGAIHCYADASQVASNPLAAQTAPVAREALLKHKSYAGPIPSPERVPAEIHGPFTEFVGPDQVRVRWETTVPMTSDLRFGIDMPTPQSHVQTSPQQKHEFIVTQVQREVIYRFQVGGETETGEEILSEPYRFDAHLNYLPSQVPAHPSPYSAATLQQAQAQLRSLPELLDVRRGYALVLGADDGSLAYALAKATDLQVIIVEADRERLAQIRNRLAPTGMLGTRISLHQQDPKAARYGPYLANVILSERWTGPPPAAALQYCLRPAGGRVYWSLDPEALPDVPGDAGAWESIDGQLHMYRRGKLAGTGEWTHQYGLADNAACSRDDQVQGAMTALWWGRPGARPMPDRGNRNPAPVSANGRLYVQGNRTLFGLDAYNGAILWAKQIPTMRRANMPRDGSNMVATDDYVSVAIGNRLVMFDGDSGERLRDLAIPEEAQDVERKHDWGYVAQVDAQLFGTTVRRGSHYLGDRGEWYQSSKPEDVAKVTSDSLFAINKYSGETEWVFQDGVLLNSTITIADGRVYAIVSRDEQALGAESGRLLDELSQSQVLLAIDRSNGAVLWEREFDFSKCRFVTYVTHGSGVLLVTGSDAKSVFHTYAFDAASGEPRWQHSAPDKKGHHTGELAHPTIVGSRAYFNKHTYDLKTGEVLGLHNFNWHGCGVMSASNHTVFSRYEFHGMLDLKTNERTEFLGIRSGCWLSLIPSGGLLLAPETSAGCSCGHSIQTSIAYVPQSVASPNDAPRE